MDSEWVAGAPVLIAALVFVVAVTLVLIQLCRERDHRKERSAQRDGSRRDGGL